MAITRTPAAPAGAKAPVEAPKPNPDKTFDVRFSVRDTYRITLTAACKEDALQMAADIYDTEYEKAFKLDHSNSGTDDWHAEEVLS